MIDGIFSGLENKFKIEAITGGKNGCESFQLFNCRTSLKRMFQESDCFSFEVKTISNVMSELHSFFFFYLCLNSNCWRKEETLHYNREAFERWCIINRTFWVRQRQEISSSLLVTSKILCSQYFIQKIFKLLEGKNYKKQMQVQSRHRSFEGHTFVNRI